MKIIKIVPDITSLRNYLQKAEEAGFGFSEALRKTRRSKFSNEIQKLDKGSVQSLLNEHHLNPDYLYYIGDENYRRITGEPFLTAVADLNLEDNLVVFEAYNSQVYYLFTGSGELIQGPCHDLELGYGGLIQYRNSGGDPVFQMRNLNDSEFHKIGGVRPFEHFPYTRGISFLQGIEAVYFKDPRIDIRKNENRKYILGMVKRNGWSLQYASAELRDDEEIVTAACISKSGSLLFASERIKKNISFLTDLQSRISGQFYGYLNPDNP